MNLRNQPAAVLADALIELANDHPDVHKRLQRLQQYVSPSKVAAAFGMTLVAVRKACRHWLNTAARCEAPEAALRERLLKLAKADGYGAREGLLREANLLLSERVMHELVSELEGAMVGLLVAEHRGASHPHLAPPPNPIPGLRTSSSIQAHSGREAQNAVRQRRQTS